MSNQSMPSSMLIKKASSAVKTLTKRAQDLEKFIETRETEISKLAASQSFLFDIMKEEFGTSIPYSNYQEFQKQASEISKLGLDSVKTAMSLKGGGLLLGKEAGDPATTKKEGAAAKFEQLLNTLEEFGG